MVARNWEAFFTLQNSLPPWGHDQGIINPSKRIHENWVSLRQKIQLPSFLVDPRLIFVPKDKYVIYCQNSGQGLAYGFLSFDG